jgi:hypothetical protein
VLTEDPERAAEVADELDHVNAERRLTEQRILFADEAQVAEQGDRPAYVLAGEDWHPGVVASWPAGSPSGYHRPAVLIALDGATGTGSGRSVPGFDLLGGLDASAEHLLRHGGHKAAAGLEIGREDDATAFRRAFCAHADEHADRGDARAGRDAVDAVVAGDELGMAGPRSSSSSRRSGRATPGVNLLSRRARAADPRPMGENRHVRFTVEAGGMRARAVAFGTDGKLPCDADGPFDATFRLGAQRVEARRAAARPALRAAVGAGVDHPGRDAPWLERRPSPRLPLRCRGPPLPGARARPAGPPEPAARPPRRRRRGTIHALVAAASPCSSSAHSAGGACALTAARRLRADLATPRSSAIRRWPRVRARRPARSAAPGVAAPGGPMVHLAYGEAEVTFLVSIQ